MHGRQLQRALDLIEEILTNPDNDGADADFDALDDEVKDQLLTAVRNANDILDLEARRKKLDLRKGGSRPPRRPRPPRRRRGER